MSIKFSWEAILWYSTLNILIIRKVILSFNKFLLLIKKMLKLLASHILNVTRGESVFLTGH
jgi:hypothetical protein